MKLVLVNNDDAHKIIDAENGNSWVYEAEGENKQSDVARLIFNCGLFLVDDEAARMWYWLNQHLAE